MSHNLIEIENLHVRIEDKEILRGVDLVVPPGEIHALMGPNGSGKSTLANVLMGHPAYEVTEGIIRFRGQDITQAAVDERARLGMFLAFQYPQEVPGVSLMNFLRSSMTALQGQALSMREFRQQVEKRLGDLGLDMTFARRSLNEGFSGGEKKRNEILQLSLLDPFLAILDETDSGLDVDGIRQVASQVKDFCRPERGILLITHYMRILDHLRPDRVHILIDGKVAQSGGPELAHSLDREGFGGLRKAQKSNGRSAHVGAF